MGVVVAVGGAGDLLRTPVKAVYKYVLFRDSIQSLAA
jgi:hypothetical protein